nr:MAG TPA: hypothetical protein [Microviridae sp.]
MFWAVIFLGLIRRLSPLRRRITLLKPLCVLLR